MLKHLWILALLVSMAFLPAASALMIADPENVTYVKAEMVQSGKITLVSSSPRAMAEQLVLSLYVAQNDSRQHARITRVMGPDSHSMGQDEYGNTQIVLSWLDPPVDRPIDYLVETEIEASSDPVTETRNFPVTRLVKPSQEIIEAAYTVGAGPKSAEKMLGMAAWVHGHVQYDSSCCEEVTLPASWVCEHGKGTCDEYSNLLVAMLKVLGYRSWYVAGYAYLGGKQEGAESSFGAHAWVETWLEGKTYSMDPTWAESPVDATHLTLARMPDSNFTEHTEVKGRDVSISWEKDETRLQLIDYRENPRIEMGLEAIPDSVAGGKSMLFVTSLSADGCVLTNLRIASCVRDDGEKLLRFDAEDMPVYFCGSRELHWIAGTPGIGYGLKYTCGVRAAGGGGSVRKTVEIVHSSDENMDISMSTGKILVPGQQAEVNVMLKNNGFASEDVRVFAILGDGMAEKGVTVGGRGTGAVTFNVTVPGIPGKYYLHVFCSSGDLLTEDVSVVSERDMRITEIELPGKVKHGETDTINVTVSNAGEWGEASVLLQIGDYEYSSVAEIEGGGSVTVRFDFEGGAEGQKSVVISVLDGNGEYQDSWAGTIEVVREPSLKESISGQLEGFFAWLWEIIGSIFGANA